MNATVIFWGVFGLFVFADLFLSHIRRVAGDAVEGWQHDGLVLAGARDGKLRPAE